MITRPLQEHWEWQKDRRKDVWHGSEKILMMYIASMDIETAFDFAWPKHIAKMLGDQFCPVCSQMDYSSSIT